MIQQLIMIEKNNKSEELLPSSYDKIMLIIVNQKIDCKKTLM